MALLPPVFALLKASAAVTAILGAVPKVFRHGIAPQGTVAPYVVWSTVATDPETSISELPPVDRVVVQIDCYHATDGGIEQLATAVRDAIEAAGHRTTVAVDQRELDTGLFRIGLQADWWLSR